MEQDAESFFDSYDITVQGKESEEALDYIEEFLNTIRYGTPLETIEDERTFHEFMGNLKITLKNAPAASCMGQDGKSFLDSFDIEVCGKKGEDARDYLEEFLNTTHYCSSSETMEDELAFNEFMANVKVTLKNPIQKENETPKLSKTQKRKFRRKRAQEARKLKQQEVNWEY